MCSDVASYQAARQPRSLTQSADARWDSGRAEVPPTPAPCQRAPTCSQGSGWLTSRTPCSRPTRGPTGETDASTLESHGPARHWMWLHINVVPWWTPGRGQQKRRQRSLPLANVTGSRGAAVPTRLVLNLSSSKFEEAERFAASPGRASTARRTPRVQTGWHSPGATCGQRPWRGGLGAMDTARRGPDAEWGQGPWESERGSEDARASRRPRREWAAPRRPGGRLPGGPPACGGRRPDGAWWGRTPSTGSGDRGTPAGAGPQASPQGHPQPGAPHSRGGSWGPSQWDTVAWVTLVSTW